MLRPRAVQSTLQALLESPGVPADTALVVFSDSGTIYAQAHLQDATQIASSSTLPDESRQQIKITESQRLQFARQPGLSSLLGNPEARAGLRNTTSSSSDLLTPNGPTVELVLQNDERCKILAALACQSWQEETNRVKRLFSKVHGHQAAVAMSETSDRMHSFSASTAGGRGAEGSGSGNGNGKNGILKKKVEQNGIHRSIAPLNSSEENHLERGSIEPIEEQESVAAPVAVPGTLFNIGTNTQSVAPLLLEGELGALLIMPLHHQALTSTPSSPSLPQYNSTLLLVLSAGSHHVSRASVISTGRGVGSGTSLLSQQQWNELHNAASAFTSRVSLPLRKAFGRNETDAIADAVTMSDIESSVDFEGLTAGNGPGTDGQASIIVR